MKKFKAIIILLLITLFVCFLQVNVFTWFNIAGIMPSFYVVFVLLVGLFTGNKIGLLTGIGLGIVIDSVNSSEFKLTFLLLGIVGLVGEILDRNFSKNNLITILVMCIITTIFFEIIQMIIRAVLLQLSIDLFSFIGILLVEILFNILLIMIFYNSIKKVGYYLEDVFKSKKVLTKYY